MKIDFRQLVKKKQTLRLLASVAFFAVVSNDCFAQVSITNLEKKDEAKAIIPNLSVHFTLNSAISEEETEYYKEIVEELLHSMPKEVELRGANRSLLSGSQKYDKLRVVSYLPDATLLKDDPTARDISYFDIKFEAPDAEKLARMKAQDKALYNPSVFVRTDRLEAFMKKVDALRGGEEMQELPTPSVEEGDIENQSISAAALVMPKPRPLPEPKAMPAKSTRSSKTEASKTEAPKPEQPKPEAPKPVEYKLTYMGDVAAPRSLDDKALQNFADKIKKSGRLDIVSYTVNSPFQAADTLYELRLEKLQSMLESKGVMWNGLKVSEIRLRASLSGAQEIQLWSGRVKL